MTSVVRSTTKQLDSAARSIEASNSILYYGQRLGMLSQVSTIVGGVFKQEESERRVLLSVFQQDRSTRAAPHVTAKVEIFRISGNKIEIDEHEDRWELAHLEYAVDKAMYSQFVAEGHIAAVALLKQHAIQRANIEREATLLVGEIAMTWGYYFRNMYECFIVPWRLLLALSQARVLLQEDEADSRQTFHGHEKVRWSHLTRHFSQGVEALSGVQVEFLRLLAIQKEKEKVASLDKLLQQELEVFQQQLNSDRTMMFLEEGKQRKILRIDEDAQFVDLGRLESLRRINLF